MNVFAEAAWELSSDQHLSHLIKIEIMTTQHDPRQFDGPLKNSDNFLCCIFKLPSWYYSIDGRPKKGGSLNTRLDYDYETDVSVWVTCPL